MHLGYRTLFSTSLRHVHASLGPFLSDSASFSPLPFITSPLLAGNCVVSSVDVTEAPFVCHIANRVSQGSVLLVFPVVG